MEFSKLSPKLIWGTALVLAVIPFCFLAMVIGHRLDLPTSAWEFDFNRQLRKASSRHTQEIPLTSIARGDWELVCSSDGYDSSIFLKQYNKTFEPAGRADDGAWGLIFISRDGSHQSAKGSCTFPGVLLESGGCIQRSQARLVLERNSKDCPTYALAGGN